MPDRKSQTDAELARLVIEQKLATKEEVQHCLDLLEAEGPPEAEDARQRTLADVLIGQGMVTERQIRRVKTTIEEASRAQEIPGYRFMEKVGSGAMAHVFKAKQLALDRIVAIKVLPPRLWSENPEYLDRFYKEGKAAAKLNHPNIVQVFDVGEAGGYHFIVMEYVEGHTVYDELAKGKVFEEADALRLIIQIARALEHAHSQGLIHRDVKPKNIMIAPDGTAKLADMGLARVATDLEAAQAEAGRAFGTPYYISPEQIRGEVDIDFRADIYSLGGTLYHMVTGTVPFDGPTPMAVMQEHLREPLVPPDHVNTRLSSGLGEVVEMMMAKEPERRYASTSDLLVDLEAIQAGDSPLIARRQFDAEVLEHLEAEAESEPKTRLSPENKNLISIIIILAAALGVALLVIIVLLALLAGQ